MSLSVTLISAVLAAWIWSDSSIRLRSTCWRKRVDLVGGNPAFIGDGEQRETLVDVGLRDDLAIHDCGRLDDRRAWPGRRSVDCPAGEARSRCRRLVHFAAAFCAAAPVATASTNAAAANRARAGKKSNAADTCENPLLFKPNERIGVYSAPLNAGLAAETLERYPEREGASLVETRRTAHSPAATRRQAQCIRPHSRC